MLKTKCFPYSADLARADPGRMIAPATSDKAEHIRQLLISESPPELRHGDSGRRRPCAWHGGPGQHQVNQRDRVLRVDRLVLDQTGEGSIRAGPVRTVAGVAIVQIDLSPAH